MRALVKPLQLISTVIILMILVILYFGYTSASKIEAQHQVTQDFYNHPFKVSTASAKLENALVKMRVNMLLLSRTDNPVDMYKTIEAVALNSFVANKQVKVIRQGFLGDMNKVSELEGILQDWATLRTEIIKNRTLGNSAEARLLATQHGQDMFSRSEVITSYISSYAEQKAVFFEKKAFSNYNAMILNVFWTMAAIILLISALGFYVLRVTYLHSKQLESDAYIDSLTGMLNRLHFNVLAENARKQAERYDKRLSILIIDIDYFKNVNDKYGHNGGDVVLKALARLLKKTLRDTDIACRWGGEEFVVLMPETDLEGAQTIAKRLNKGFESLSVKYKGMSISCTISIGITTFSDHDDVKSMIADADKALYHSKETGRNKVVCFKDIEDYEAKGLAG